VRDCSTRVCRLGVFEWGAPVPKLSAKAAEKIKSFEQTS
jgi:hypothetical protein